MRPLRPKRRKVRAHNGDMVEAITCIASVLEKGPGRRSIRGRIGGAIARLGLWICGWEIVEVTIK